MKFFPFTLSWTLFPTLLIFNSRLTFCTFAKNTNTRTHTIEGISWSCRFLHFILLTQWCIHSLFLLILAPACVFFLQALLQFPKDALNLRFTCTGGSILRLHTLHFLLTAGHTNSSSQRGTTVGEGNRRWKRCQDFQWAIGRLEPNTLQLLQWDKKQLWIPCNGEVWLVLQFWLLVSLSMCVHAKLLSCVRLFATLWTVAHQAPLSMGFSTQEHWSGLLCPPPGHLPDPGIKPVSLTSAVLAGGFFTLLPAGKTTLPHLYSQH